jgi:hypothetical protein
LLLDHDALVATLQDVADTPLAAVESLREHLVQTPHPRDQVRLRRLEEQMVMAVHQTSGIQQPTLLLHLLGEALNEAAAILLIEEDRLLRVAARGDVINGAGKLESQRACHTEG